MGYVLTIAGVTQRIQTNSLAISETINTPNTLTCVIRSADGSNRPAMDAEIILTEDGTRIFAGYIQTPTEHGTGDVGLADITTEISAIDYNSIPDRIVINATFAGGTLKSMMTTLLAYLNGAGGGAAITYAIVGGGGGGGSGHDSGGGGGGGIQLSTVSVPSTGTYPVVVGTGGAAASPGNQSSFLGIILPGGGAGGSGPTGPGGDGGSGGGASYDVTGGGTGGYGLGDATLGFNGGEGRVSPNAGGGGGGAIAPGGNGNVAGSGVGGYGGYGVVSSINGVATMYSAGGGAGGDTSGGLSGNVFLGGGAGGGPGADGAAGLTNTGGGGGGAGGAGHVGGAGGSGIVIIAYPTGAYTATGGVVTTNGGNTIHVFTSSGNWVVTAVAGSTAGFGITIDPLQADGPTLLANTYAYVKASDILKSWSVQTNWTYLWEIDYNKVFRFYAGGSKIAPFNVALGDGHAIGDVTVGPSRVNTQNPYANKIYLIGGTATAPFNSIASSPSEMALYGEYDLAVSAPNVTTQAGADAMAASQLAIHIIAPRTITYSTTQIGLACGDVQVIDLLTRQIKATCLITDIQTRDGIGDGTQLLRTVTLIEGTQYIGNWQNIYSSLFTTPPAPSGTVYLSDGSVSAPSLTFTTETDLGLYHPSDDLVGFAADNTKIATIGIRTLSAVDVPTINIAAGGLLTWTLPGGGNGPSIQQGFFGASENQIGVSDTSIPFDVTGTWNCGVLNTRGGGGSPASSGVIRNQTGQAINWRNAAGSADVLGLRVDSLDIVEVGTNAKVAVAGANSGGTFISGAEFATLAQDLTIAAAATTSSAIQLPANAIILGVAVRVTNTIPTAATFTVTTATPTTTWNTAAVATASGSNDPGTLAAPQFQVTASVVTITPDLTPATGIGVVRIIVSYYTMVTHS